MSQVRQKTERVGEIAAKAVVQLLFSTGKSFTVDGLREKLREFFREEVRAELRAVAALSNVELITALLSCNRQLVPALPQPHGLDAHLQNIQSPTGYITVDIEGRKHGEDIVLSG
jgi:hypothetical protein